MARIAGVNLPTNKRVVIALQYIHGIGAAKAKEITDKLSIAPERRVQDLTDAEARRHVLRVFHQHLAENLLRRLELAARVDTCGDRAVDQHVAHALALAIALLALAIRLFEKRDIYT